MIKIAQSLNTISVDNRPSLSETDLVVVVDGDSIVRSNQGGGGEQYWPTNLFSWLSTVAKSVEGYSFGIGGQTIQQMLTNAPSKIDPLVNPSKTNLIIAWEDVNAMGATGQQPAAQTLADNQDYHSGRKLAGYDYGIWMTTYYPRMPYGAGFLPPYDAVKIDYYENLVPALDQSLQPWDVYLKLALAPNIGGPVDQPFDPTYFADTIHLNNAGYDILEQQVRAGIMTIFKP